MEASKSKDSLRAAGKKRLEEFRLKRQQRGEPKNAAGDGGSAASIKDGAATAEQSGDQNEMEETRICDSTTQNRSDTGSKDAISLHSQIQDSEKIDSRSQDDSSTTSLEALEKLQQEKEQILGERSNLSMKVQQLESQLRSVVSDGDRQLQSMKSQLESCLSDRAELDSALATLRDRADQNDGFIQETEAELDRVVSFIKGSFDEETAGLDLQSSWRTVLDCVKAIKTKTEVKEDKINELIRRVDQLEEEKGVVESRISSSAKELASLRNRLDSDREEHREAIAAKNRMIEENLLLLRSRETEIQGLIDEKDSWSKQLTDDLQEKASQSAQIDSLARKVDELSSELEDAGKREQDILLELQSVKDLLDQQKKDSETKFGERDQEIERLRVCLSDAGDHLLVESENWKQQLEDARRICGQNLHELETLKNDLQRESQGAEILEEQAKISREELDDLAAEKSRLLKQISAQSDELKAHQADLAIKSSTIDELSKNLEIMRDESSSSISIQENRNKSLQEQIVDLEQRLGDAVDASERLNDLDDRVRAHQERSVRTLETLADTNEKYAARLNEESTKLQIQLDALERSMMDQTDQLKNLIAEVIEDPDASLEICIASLVDKLRRVDEELRSLRSDLGDAQAKEVDRNEETKIEVTRLQEREQSLLEELARSNLLADEAKNEADRLSIECGELRDRVRELEEDGSVSKQETEMLETVRVMQNDLATANSALGQLQLQLQKSEKEARIAASRAEECDALKRNLADAEAASSMFERKLAEAEATLSMHEQKLAEAEATSLTYMKKLADAEAASSAFEQKLADAKATTSMFEQKLADAEATTSTYEKMLADAEARYERKLAEAEAASSTYAKKLADAEATYEKKLADAEATSSMYEQKLADAEATSSMSERKLAEAEAIKLADAEATASTYEKKLADAEATYEKKLADAEATSSMYEQKLADAEATSSMSERKLAEAEAIKLADAEATASTYEKKLADAEATSSMHQQKLAEALAEAEAASSTYVKKLADCEAAYAKKLADAQGTTSTYMKKLADAEAASSTYEKLAEAEATYKKRLADAEATSSMHERKLAEAEAISSTYENKLADTTSTYEQKLADSATQIGLLGSSCKEKIACIREIEDLIRGVWDVPDLQHVDAAGKVQLFVAEFQEAQERASAAKTELEKVDGKVDRLTEELKLQTQDRIDAVRDLERLRADYDRERRSIEAKIRDFEDKLHGLLSTASGVLSDKMEFISSSAENDVVSALDRCVNTLASQFVASIESKKQLLLQVKHLEESNRELQDEISNKTALLEDHKDQARAMAVEVKQLKTDADSENSAYRRDFQAATAERDRLQRELIESEQKLGSVREKLSLAIKKGKSVTQHRDDLKQLLSEKSDELDRSNRQRDALEESLKNKVLQLESEQKSEREALEAKIRALDAELRSKNDEMSSCKVLIREGGDREKKLAAELSVLKRKFAQVVEEKQMLEESSRDTWLDLERASAELKKSRSNQTDLEQTLAAVEETKNRLQKELSSIRPAAEELRRVLALQSESFDRKTATLADVEKLISSLQQLLGFEKNWQLIFKMPSSLDDHDNKVRSFKQGSLELAAMFYTGLELVKDGQEIELALILEKSSTIKQLLHETLTEISSFQKESREALDKKDQELVSYQMQISSKNREIESLSRDNELKIKQLDILSDRVAELEYSIEQNHLTMDNMESSRSKAVGKLTFTLGKFKELQQQCEAMLTEIENLQTSLDSRQAELAGLNQKIEILQQELDQKTEASTQLERSLKLLAAKSKAGQRAEPLLQEPKAVVELLDVQIQRLQHENESLQLQVRTKDSELQVLKVKAAPPPSSTSEIEELEQPRHLNVVVPHIRSQKRVVGDHQVAIDLDAVQTMEIEEKGNAFKSLGMIRFLPRAGHHIADRVDEICISGGRLLMRQPVARLSLIVYWIAIHVWIAATVTMAKI